MAPSGRGSEVVRPVTVGVPGRSRGCGVICPVERPRKPPLAVRRLGHREIKAAGKEKRLGLRLWQ